MIVIKLHNTTINIPDSWDELTNTQYLGVCGVLEQMQHGDMSMYSARMAILQLLTGYKRSNKRYNDADATQINDNLNILSSMITFMFKPEYPDNGVMEVFTPELQQLLTKRFPFEIHQKQFTDQIEMAGNLLEYRIGFNLQINRNPLPYIKNGFMSNIYGPTWQIDQNNMLITDMLAEEYIDALDYYKLYRQSQNTNYLGGLVAALYRPNRNKYNSVDVQKTAEAYTSKPINVKMGVYFFFQAVQEYLINRSGWAILFARSEAAPTQPNNKISLGMIGHLYSLSKDGYGSKEELSALNLKDFLNLMLKQLQDTISQMRSNGVKDYEIAGKLHLPIETILQL